MLAGLHLKHVASRPKTLSAHPWVSGECRRDYIIPCGFNSRVWVDVGREKFGWEESRQELSSVRLLGGRMLAGTTYPVTINVSVVSLSAL
jgi:hypothetical protein